MYLCEPGCEDLWLLFEAKWSPRAKFWETLVWRIPATVTVILKEGEMTHGFESNFDEVKKRFSSKSHIEDLQILSMQPLLLPIFE